MKTVSVVSGQQSKTYVYWLKKNWYYHHFIAKLYGFLVPIHSSVLQIQCRNGFLLSSLTPSFGVGIDENASYIQEAHNTYSSFTFIHQSINSLPIDKTFDYILLSSAIMEAEDVQLVLEKVRQFSHESTRIILDFYSCAWEPVLWITQKLGLRRTTSLKNWLSKNDVKNFLHLAGFDLIRHEAHILIPIYIPFFSWFINTYIAPLPGINSLCLTQIMIARPLSTPDKKTEHSVSIIIPCRNERGNIEGAVLRCPSMGAWTEIIFVEGNSHDGTLEEIKRVQEKYPEKRIRYFVQDGKGKGNAVHLGFSQAHGDILMIQDGDLTAPPEELPKFYHALVNAKGEFINGSRLVYGMEDEAMRPLNLFANFCFARGFSWLLGQTIKDTLCGTKVLFKKDYQKIWQNRAFFGNFDPFGDFDLLFGSAKQNLKIIDMPVHYKNRTYGSTQISRFRNGFSLLCMWLLAFKKFKLR
jgi:hypothetical protein